MVVAALESIRAERARQESMYEAGELRWVASAPECPDPLRLAALVEEVGEVARAYHDGTDVREELVHVAAVACAWIEALDQTRLAV